MKRRFNIRGAADEPAMILDKISVRNQRLVYVAVANKAVSYPEGKSPILYIGTTKKGVGRIASSAAHRASQIFEIRGVGEVKFYVLTCKGRQKVVKAWHKLERALILRFRELYGSPPRCNKQGVGMRWRDERDYFRAAGLARTLRKLEDR